MNIKVFAAAFVVLLLGIIGFNYYSSQKAEQRAAAHSAEVAKLQAKAAAIDTGSSDTKTQANEPVQPFSSNQPQEQAAAMPVASDTELFDTKPPAKQKISKETSDSLCESVIPVAEKVMRARQDGIAISNALDFANGIKDGTAANDSVSNITKQMVIKAYSMPSFSTESYKDNAVREFGAKQYLICMRAFN